MWHPVCRPVPANPYGVFGADVAVNTVVTDTVPDFVAVKIRLSGGALRAEMVNTGRVRGANALSATATVGAGSVVGGLKWAVTVADGGFTGSFTHPASNVRVGSSHSSR
jgi:hypothetical protein